MRDKGANPFVHRVRVVSSTAGMRESVLHVTLWGILCPLCPGPADKNVSAMFTLINIAFRHFHLSNGFF